MNDKRKEQLKRLNIRQIQPNGIYIKVNSEGTIVDMIKLTNEDIVFLRDYHRNINIASQVEIPVVMRKPISDVKINKRVKVSRDQKYTMSNYKLKENIKVVGKSIIIFGMVICLTVGGYKILSQKKDVPVLPDEYETTMVDDYYLEDGKNYMEIPTEIATQVVVEEDVQEFNRAEYIKMLCDVFQVDYKVTYDKLVELTDNFSSVEYLEGKHPLVTCKGRVVDAQSEEEFLVYAIRIISMAPNKVNLSKDRVCINNGYNSGTDYISMIAKWAEILDEDPALVYGIMRAETSFNSDLLNNSNNPAGLKTGGVNNHFWVFDNKDAGIIELIMEIKKYRYKGANTIEEMSKIHCPIDDPDDKYGLNVNWVGNVTSGYEDGRKIYEDLGFYKSNGLSH